MAVSKEIFRAFSIMGYEEGDELPTSAETNKIRPPQDRLFKYSGLKETEIRKLKFSITLSVALTLLIASVKPLALIAIAAIIASGWLKLSRIVSTRARAFESDYPAFLLSLASSIRTGADPFDAFLKSIDLFKEDSVLREELLKSMELTKTGQREAEIVRKFARTIRHPDIELFRTAFVLSRQEGTSLSECLHRLAKVTRQRQSFRRKVRAALAMQKLSAFGIAGCAVLITAIQFLSNPESMNTALSSPEGIKLISFGATMLTGGLIWMLAISRTKV